MSVKVVDGTVVVVVLVWSVVLVGTVVIEELDISWFMDPVLVISLFDSSVVVPVVLNTDSVGLCGYISVVEFRPSCSVELLD